MDVVAHDDLITPEMLELWNQLMAMQKAKPGRAHHDREYFDISTELRQLLGLKTWQWGPHEIDWEPEGEDDERALRLRGAFERAAARRAKQAHKL